MDDIVEGVKSAADTIGQVAEEAIRIQPEKKLYERVVPIPEVKVHTHLPARTIGSIRNT